MSEVISSNQIRPDQKSSLSGLLGWGALFLVLLWSWQGSEMNPSALIKYSGNMVKLGSDFFPPNFHEWEFYVAEMLITIH